VCRHAACLYGLLASRPDLNILGGLSPSEWRDVRRMIVGAVLQTDMTHHFSMVSKVGITVSCGSADGYDATLPHRLQGVYTME
jgi:cAMP-specific phosphodiesterase 4